MQQVDSPDVLERFSAELALVDVVARQVTRAIRQWVDFDDLISAGREGLLDAARRYDPTRQVTFRVFANFRVRGAMLDVIRRTGPVPRSLYQKASALQAATSLGEGHCEYAAPPPSLIDGEAEQALIERAGIMATAAALGALVPSPREDPESIASAGPNPEEALARAELVALVRDAIAALPEREAEVVRLHTLEGQRIEDVAVLLGIDRSWAIRVHARAMDRLTKRLRPAL